MTIDEFIELLKNGGYLTNREEEQIAEWLEKLKTIENIMLIYNANWYADEDNGVPDSEVLESIWNVIQNNGLDIDIEQDYRKGKSEGYNKAIDDAKSVILQTLDNEILVDTLHLRLEQLKEGATSEADNQ